MSMARRFTPEEEVIPGTKGFRLVLRGLTCCREETS